jgi:predicted ester cyclase
MSEEANKAIVRRYFAEVLDGGNPSLIPELFASSGISHFPGRDVSAAHVRPETPGRRFATTIHHLLAEGDCVVAHLTHHVTYEDAARFLTRIGPVEVGGRSVSWDAMALFHFRDGKIDEEWVSRDELDVLIQLGAVSLAPPE